MGSIRRIIEPQFIPVEARRLMLNLPIPFDVFVEEKAGTNQVFSKGTVFTQDSRQLLIKTGTEIVYVRSHEKVALEQYLSRERSAARKTSYNDPLEFRKSALYRDRYYQVEHSTLKAGTTVDFSLYTVMGFDVFPLLKASEESPALLDDSALKSGNDFVISKADIPRYRAYLSSPGVSQGTDRALLTKENGKIAVKELLENPSDEKKIDEVTGNVETIVDQIFDNSDVMYSMLSMQNNTYYVYTHSINVAVLAIGLASTIGLSGDKLLELGIGAALHDVGMSVISPEITNKQGKLTYSEYAILRMHVGEGEKLLRENKNIPEGALVPVMQHHEKLSGKGYPHKLKGDDIKLLGRITGIADCYDSLITARPYRPSYKPFEALSILARETDNYDPELLKVFIRMLGKVSMG